MAFDATTYVLSKKYTNDSIAGGGISAGKNCQIEQITEITGGHRVHFKWELDNGTVKRQTMDVMTGDKGAKGDKGDTGNTGAKGDTSTITIGSVTSGVTPTVENVGTATDAIFNFTFPKGDKGDKGDKGNDGADGKSFEIKSRFATEADLIAAYPDGPDNPSDAYFVGTTSSPDLYTWLSDDHEWNNNGPIAGVKGDKGDTGDDGFSPIASVSKSNGVATISIRDKTGQTTAQVSDGTNGKSAYEVAVDEGFVGTESEWLASLVGADGAAGANGSNGADGISPVANVTKTGDVYKIHIQDAVGTTEQTIDMSSYASASDVPKVKVKEESITTNSSGYLFLPKGTFAASVDYNTCLLLAWGTNVISKVYVNQALSTPSFGTFVANTNYTVRYHYIE